MAGFKEGQTVWFISTHNMHLKYCACKGKFIKRSDTRGSGLDYEPTVEVCSLDEDCFDSEVLEDWVFTTKEEAENCRRQILRNSIKRKEEEIKSLKHQLAK